MDGPYAGSYRTAGLARIDDFDNEVFIAGFALDHPIAFVILCRKRDRDCLVCFVAVGTKHGEMLTLDSIIDRHEPPPI